ncbi:gamma-glutamylaminecyclotransferase-like [Dunckerocampus dactyliophorus]|uniref:gamma-glutamylaminecyclotransferase-like n=1 Tax=Dunckerocampus dactyliophorus TaxID=161453 RepID=UPI002406B891|nr:gamma-glutamylaminecyclotransferase-like [Dunckerocampus dactyliophorus]
MALVFVYGTLKRGQPNNFYMTDKRNGHAWLLASAVTTQTFPLVIAGQNNIPFLLNIPGQGHRVHGELYKVDEALLRFLDDFEDIPDMYQRSPVTLTVEEWLGPAHEEELAPGSVTQAFVYSTTTYQPDWPSLTHYANYDSRGDHGLIYGGRDTTQHN